MVGSARYRVRINTVRFFPDLKYNKTKHLERRTKFPLRCILIAQVITSHPLDSVLCS